MLRTEQMIKEAQEERDLLYKTDITYKALVDNYCKTSFLHEKGKATDQEFSESLNALSRYREKLRSDSVLRFVKELNLTDEDIRDMLMQGILDSKIMIKILKFKGYIGGDENNND